MDGSIGSRSERMRALINSVFRPLPFGKTDERLHLLAQHHLLVAVAIQTAARCACRDEVDPVVVRRTLVDHFEGR